MDRIYVINYEYANEKYDAYERGAECAFTDLNKAKERLAELTEGLKDEMLENFDEDDIVEEKGNITAIRNIIRTIGLMKLILRNSLA